MELQILNPFALSLSKGCPSSGPLDQSKVQGLNLRFSFAADKLSPNGESR
jgi:hypothetical protein